MLPASISLTTTAQGICISWFPGLARGRLITRLTFRRANSNFLEPRNPSPTGASKGQIMGPLTLNTENLTVDGFNSKTKVRSWDCEWYSHQAMIWSDARYPRSCVAGPTYSSCQTETASLSSVVCQRQTTSPFVCSPASPFCILFAVRLSTAM
jgi:hypothetical protein